MGRILDGFLLSDAEIETFSRNNKATSPRKELKVRLREVATPVLSMGKRYCRIN